MNKIIFIFYSLFFSVALSMAQVNPKPGYVITNTGDTIRGMIDFRTNEVLSKKCIFRANGESETKTYKPGEIESFRFDHIGKFFVTRRFNIYGEPQLYFAEFMVQGMMNLYCVADTYDEYFFFEREDGEMALLTNRHTTPSSYDEEKIQLQEKKEQFGKVKLLLQNSLKATDGMNDLNMSRKKLVTVVRDYHADVCTNGGSCIVYEYKEKADKVKTHFKAFAGYAYYSHERTDHQTPVLQNENYSGSAFEIGIGLETDIEWVIKGGSIEMGLAYSPKATFEHDVTVIGGREPSHTMYEKSRITFTLGAVKRFGKGKIKPLVRGGGFYVFHHGNKETRYYKSDKIFEQKWGNTSHFGVYLGAGVQMPIDKHYVRLHADWYKSLEDTDKGNMMRWGLTAEFAL